MTAERRWTVEFRSFGRVPALAGARRDHCLHSCLYAFLLHGLASHPEKVLNSRDCVRRGKLVSSHGEGCAPGQAGPSRSAYASCNRAVSHRTTRHLTRGVVGSLSVNSALVFTDGGTFSGRHNHVGRRRLQDAAQARRLASPEELCPPRLYLICFPLSRRDDVLRQGCAQTLRCVVPVWRQDRRVV